MDRHRVVIVACGFGDLFASAPRRVSGVTRRVHQPL